MLPSKHIIYSAFLCLLFFIILPYGKILPYLIIFLSSILIDIDHYFPYIVKGKFSLLGNYKEQIYLSKQMKNLSKQEKRKYKKATFLFHGIEFILILFLLSFLNKIFFFILLGVFLHLLLDILDLIEQKEPVYLKTSQIYVLIKNKGKISM